MKAYRQDVAVVPEHQSRGVGKQIIETLLAYIKKNKYNAFIGLFASEGKDKFYEHYGFGNHSPEMTGMFTVTIAIM
ncbi:MAG: GNAT family N-acetyltransferase [Paenibacillaceae bacterium]